MKEMPCGMFPFFFATNRTMTNRIKTRCARRSKYGCSFLTHSMRRMNSFNYPFLFAIAIRARHRISLISKNFTCPFTWCAFDCLGMRFHFSRPEKICTSSFLLGDFTMFQSGSRELPGLFPTRVIVLYLPRTMFSVLF